MGDILARVKHSNIVAGVFMCGQCHSLHQLEALSCGYFAKLLAAAREINIDPAVAAVLKWVAFWQELS